VCMACWCLPVVLGDDVRSVVGPLKWVRWSLAP